MKMELESDEEPRYYDERKRDPGYSGSASDGEDDGDIEEIIS